VIEKEEARRGEERKQERREESESRNG